MNIFRTPSNRQDCLADLRRQIGAIERGSFGSQSASALALKETSVDPGISGLFSSLPVFSGAEIADQFDFEQVWDREAMAGPALHELIADSYGNQPATRSFALALIGSLLHRQGDAQGMVLWCQRQKDVLEFGRLYGPGLRELGLSPERLIMVTGRRDADCLWAMEQGLGSKSLAAVIGVVDRVDLIASRRLSLAASTHRTHCLLLPSEHGLEPSAARTRWRVRTTPSIPDHLDEKGLGRPCWHLSLERNRFGRTGHWTMEWDHAAYRFHLAAPMAVARHNSPNEIAPRHAGVIAFDRTG